MCLYRTYILVGLNALKPHIPIHHLEFSRFYSIDNLSMHVNANGIKSPFCQFFLKKGVVGTTMSLANATLAIETNLTSR